MIFKQSISYRLVFIMILSRSRSPKRRHQDYFSFETRQNVRMREGRETKPRETRAQPYSVLLFCTFLLATRGSAEKKATARGLHQDKLNSYTTLFNVTILWIPLYYHSIVDPVRLRSPPTKLVRDRTNFPKRKLTECCCQVLHVLVIAQTVY